MLDRVVERKEMEAAFYDLENVPKNLLRNYYILVSQLIGKKNIKHNSIIYDELDHCLSLLEPEQKEYIYSRFGLVDGKFKNHDTVASIYNRERDYIRHILTYAYDTLKTLRFKYHIPSRIEFLLDEKKKIADEIKKLTDLSETPKKFEITIYDYNFSVRAINCLRRNKIITRSQLMNLTAKRLLKIDGMGAKTANEIWNKIHGVDLIK